MWKPMPGLQNMVEDGPVVHDDDRCHCVCHRNMGVMHVKPCCRPCPNCRQNIVDGKFAEHVTKCLLTRRKNP